MKIICDNCGVETDQPEAQIRRNEYHFCGMMCYTQWRRGRPRKPLPGFESAPLCACGCGNPVTFKQHRRRWNTYLPNHVLWLNHKIRKNRNNIKNSVCVQCGALFHESPSRKKRDLSNDFCSQKCYAEWKIGRNTGEKNHNWKGGYEPYYGPNWYRQRNLARKRDDYSCRYCGIAEEDLGQELDVHHIIPFREFKGNYNEANKLINLLTLCHAHHPIVEVNGL